MEWFFREKTGTRQVVPNCCRAPIPTFFFLILLALLGTRVTICVNVSLTQRQKNWRMTWCRQFFFFLWLVFGWRDQNISGIPDIYNVAGSPFCTPSPNSTHHPILLLTSTHNPILHPHPLTTTHGPPPITPHPLINLQPPTHHHTNTYPTPYISSPVSRLLSSVSGGGKSLTASRMGGRWPLGGEGRVWPTPAVWAHIGVETGLKSWKFMTRDPQNSDDLVKILKKHQGDAWSVDKTAWRSDAWRSDKKMTRAQHWLLVMHRAAEIVDC